METEEPLERGISAPEIKDNEEFVFDWPSEDIKRACEELFPGSAEWSLPALNWIASEDPPHDENTSEPMQDVRHVG